MSFEEMIADPAWVRSRLADYQLQVNDCLAEVARLRAALSHISASRHGGGGEYDLIKIAAAALAFRTHERSEGEKKERPGAVDANIHQEDHEIAREIIGRWEHTNETRRQWREVMEFDIATRLHTSRLRGREEMRERAAQAAEEHWITAANWRGDIAYVIRSLPLQAEGEDTPHG